jgi:hypothetical protein
VSGGVIFKSSVEFQGPVAFKALAEFIDKVIFKNDVEFAGKVIFSQDVAGKAIIATGQTEVKVTFDKEYVTEPIIQITPLGNYEIKYWVTDVSTKGFIVKIDPIQNKDVEFNWTATAVKEAKTIRSEVVSTPTSTPQPAINPSTTPSTEVPPSPTELPSVTPSPEPTENPELSSSATITN